MNFGLTQWGVKTPKLILKIAVICGILSSVITGTSIYVDNVRMQQFGAACLAISLITPKLFGEKEKNEEPIV